jgi:hypothetical protein
MPARTDSHPATVVTVSRRLIETPSPPGVSIDGDGSPAHAPGASLHARDVAPTRGRDLATTAIILHQLLVATTASPLTRTTWSRRVPAETLLTPSPRVARAPVTAAHSRGRYDR